MIIFLSKEKVCVQFSFDLLHLTVSRGSQSLNDSLLFTFQILDDLSKKKPCHINPCFETEIYQSRVSRRDSSLSPLIIILITLSLFNFSIVLDFAFGKIFRFGNRYIHLPADNPRTHIFITLPLSLKTEQYRWDRWESLSDFISHMRIRWRLESRSYTIILHLFDQERRWLPNPIYPFPLRRLPIVTLHATITSLLH